MSGQLGIPVEFIVGLFAGAVITLLAAELWRQLRPALARVSYLLGAGLVAAFAIAAGAMYFAGGGHFDAGIAPTGAGSAPTASPPAERTPPAADAASSTEDLEHRVSSHPDDASAWLALAEQRRAQHDYAGAREAYAKVVGLQAMSAQSWAEYAEVLGALAGGSLSGEAGAAIDNALRLDAWNAKAMWLKATQAHEQHDDAEALVWWQRLRAVLPPDSPDVTIINAKIQEVESPPTRMAPSRPVQVGR
jgi:cytochrome c-type biogenesis protein CcmH